MYNYNRMGFKKVYLGCLFNQKNIVEITDVTAENYKNEIKKLQVPAELVRGDYQVKPYFDEDFVGDSTVDFDERITESKKVISTLFPDKNIYHIKRTYKVDDGIKYSVHYTVDEVRMHYTNILDLLEKNNITRFDKNVYKCGKFLTSIYTNTKITKDGKKISRPFLLPDDDSDITKYLVSYVEEGFENWDLKFPKKKDSATVLEQIYEACDKLKVKGDKIIKVNDEEEQEEETNMRRSEYFKKTIITYVGKLNVNRSKEYSDWLEVIMCIIGIGLRYGWDENDVFNICEAFSKKCLDGYDYKKNMDIYVKLFVKDGKPKRGYKHLLSLLKEDDEDYYNKNVKKGYAEMKADFEKEFCFIRNPTCYYRTPLVPREIFDLVDVNEAEQYLKVGEFVEQTRQYQYQKCTFDKRIKKYVYKTTGFMEEWRKDPNKKSYEGLVFCPKGLTERQSKYHKNIFNGYKADNIDLDCDIDYNRIQPILDHIKIVYCSGNEEYYEYFINWLSRMIQDPEKRPQVALVFYNDEHGTGRNTFTNFFGKCILGMELAKSIHKPDRIFGRFNSVLAKCLLLVIEETSAEMKKFCEDLKNLITEPTITIEKKNIDANTFTNYVNIIMLTNNKDILDIDDKDRRFAIIESSDCKKGDKDYFKDLYECMDDRMNQKLFYMYLKNEVKCDWTPMDFQVKRPITKAYRRQQGVNSKNYKKYIHHIVSDDGVKCYGINNKWVKYNGMEYVKVLPKEMYNDYKNYCEWGKVQAYTYDKFIGHVTDKKTGINMVIPKGTHSRYLKLDKVGVLDWLKVYNEVLDENIEILDESDGIILENEEE